ncbi:pyrroline-5-carboxylate reductase [Hoyosella subflava]|uniref:Pyrroline-5-carboxylate reductase n=1 Tax=Hoyosella subflava (strain DSM 45089 / JCM 17490 / NBRC 109087 / DQS3-9A1) TaxID=443218 RepID=F6EKB6_HOYSD|nr:pyrroline-5-carboxylate reductase [Hoyosella subflava]AEF39087.1 Pyrroline-5-carboxylate reductase [Hoyosella subflava DQS3-9A1]
MTTIAVIGGGRIGEALISGLLASGREPRDVVVSERVVSRASELCRKFGIRTLSLRDASESADVVVIATKPGDVGSVVDHLVQVLDDSDREKTVVSLVAGLTAGWYEAKLPAGTPVVRVMPNTPMLVNQGMCVVAPGRYAAEEHVALVEEMLRPVGRVMTVREQMMDVITAVSGSGPAYFFLVVEAMADAAVKLGLTRDAAMELVVQTMTGSAAMLQRTLDEGGPAVLTAANELRYAVTSPGGTTAAGLAELERNGLRTSIFEALEAARDRSVELGKQLD